MAIDLNTSKKIIYQYNIHQLNLASVEFDDNYSNKCINIPKTVNNNSIINEINKIIKNCHLSIKQNDNNYEEEISHFIDEKKINLKKKFLK